MTRRILSMFSAVVGFSLLAVVLAEFLGWVHIPLEKANAINSFSSVFLGLAFLLLPKSRKGTT